MGELGDRLRQAREAKGLSLEQLEEITRIRRRYLQALEEEDLGQLPGQVFVRGFLRNYAVAVGLDPQEILAINDLRPASPAAARPDEGREPFLKEPLAAPHAGQRLVGAVVAAMAIVALALGGWTLYRQYGLPAITPAPLPSAAPTQTLAPVIVAVTATPSPTPVATTAPTLAPTDIPATRTPAPTPVPAVGVKVRMEAIQKTWVHVEVDGQLVLEAILEPGQAREWQGKEKVFLRCGNAGGLRVWYNGQEQDRLGDEGQVVEKTWTAGPLPEGEHTPPPTERTPGPLGTPPAQPSPTGTR